MSDENQQQSIPEQPVSSEPVQSPIPQEPVQPAVGPQDVPQVPGIAPLIDRKPIKPKGTLESLPSEIRWEMEDFMRQKNVNAAKDYMEKKYGKAHPEIFKLSNSAYYSYFRRHNVKNSKELSLQKQTALPPPEIMGVIEAITDPDITLADKRRALTALFDSLEARSKMLIERQTSFIDPALEALILANRKEQHAMLKTVATLSEQLSKDSDKDFLKELSDFTQVLLSSVVNTYKLVHQQDLSKFSEFSSSLSENLTNVLKTYRQAKEHLKSDKK